MDKRKVEEGQAIILSVILTCILLLTVMYYVTSSVNAAGVATHGEGMSRAEVTNVLWAQEQGLKACAIKASGVYTWEQRGQAAERFKGFAGAITGNISKSLQAQGISYGFVFNDMQARDVISNSTMENIGGVIVKNSGGATMIHGYAYDMEVYDGETSYRISNIVIIE